MLRNGARKARSVGKCAARLARFRTRYRPLPSADLRSAPCATKRFASLARALSAAVVASIARNERRRDGADDPAFPAALRGDAGRRGGQYRAAVGHAGDRARDRDRRFLGGHRLHLVGGAVGAAGALLGGKERPPRPQGADRHGRRRLHRLDDPVRHGAVRGLERLDRRRADVRPVRDVPRRFTAASAARRRRRPRPISPRKTRRSGRVAALSALSSSFGLGTIIGPAVAPLVRASAASASRGRCSPSRAIGSASSPAIVLLAARRPRRARKAGTARR